MSRNRLADETSPYLLQHRDNPVHWWAWGPESLAEAKATGKPILLSVGYAACHWCHVMAHESFEDEATARLMNEHFVNVKVDREERPDVDAIYMAALHALGEHGGWPLTMFLTPDARPFWGGTYFPPEDRYGRPSFRRVLSEIARLNRDEPEKVGANAAAILGHLRAARPREAAGRIGEAGIRDIAGRLAAAVDPVRGGIQGAPKFPQHSFFWLLWRAGIRYGLADARAAVLTTLTNLCQGGIYDHVGGGFARYSVDERWLVPHFEKMLYDNALILMLLTEAFRETGSELFRRRIEETVTFLLRDMRAPDGGFAASFDADSEGEEGKFYVWTPAEIIEVLGPADADFYCRLYDISAAGNFEGHSIPNRLGKLDLEDEAGEQRLHALNARLFEARRRRIPPGFDDKVLADWNGLAVIALAQAGEALDRADYLDEARRCYADVVRLLERDGRFKHAYRAGVAKAPATAADYANMIAAAVALHQAGGEERYLADATRWLGVLDLHYWDDQQGGYAFTADDTVDVIVRTRVASDDAVPNANATMVSNLAQLFSITGEDRHLSRAEAIIDAFVSDVVRAPSGHTGLIAASLDTLAPQLVAIVGEAGREALRAAIRTLSLPGAVVLHLADTAGLPPSSPLSGKTAPAGKAAAYVCAGPQCSLPVGDAEELRQTLTRARSAADAS